MDVSIKDRLALYDLLSPGEYDCQAVRINRAWKLKSRVVWMDVIFSADRWAS